MTSLFTYLSNGADRLLWPSSPLPFVTPAMLVQPRFLSPAQTTQDFSFSTGGQEQKSMSFRAELVRGKRGPHVVWERSWTGESGRLGCASVWLGDFVQMTSLLWFSICSRRTMSEEVNQMDPWGLLQLWLGTTLPFWQTRGRIARLCYMGSFVNQREQRQRKN